MYFVTKYILSYWHSAYVKPLHSLVFYNGFITRLVIAIDWELSVVRYITSFALPCWRENGPWFINLSLDGKLKTPKPKWYWYVPYCTKKRAWRKGACNGYVILLSNNSDFLWILTLTKWFHGGEKKIKKYTYF